MIDENTIKLYDPNVSTNRKTVSRGAISNANDTITIAGTNFNNGDAVTYRVEPVKEFAGNFIDATVTVPANGSAPSAVNDGSNRIFIQNHGFTAGQALVYRGTGISYGAGVYFNGTTQVALPAGTINDGDIIYVADSGLSTDYFRVALTSQDALGYTDQLGDADPNTFVVRPPNPLNLFQGSATAVHSVRLTSNEPLELFGGGELVDGRTYFVRDVVGSTFKLASSSGGSALNFVISPTSGGTHIFAREGVDLRSLGGANQELLFDIDSSLTGSFDGIGGAVGYASPSGGDGSSTASSTGGSGGGVNVQNSTASSTVSVSTKLNVLDGANLTAQKVFIKTDSRMGSSATADGAGGGGIQVGDAGADANGTNTSTITIGDANIEALGDLTVQANLDSDVVSQASSDGGGGITVLLADASSDLDFGTVISVNGNLTAAGALHVKTNVNNFADSEATAYGGGLGAGTDVNADSFIDNESGFKGSEIRLLGQVDLTGETVGLESEISRQKNRAYTDTVAGGVGGAALASSDARVSSNNEIILDEGASITGNTSVLIQTKYDGTDNNARAKARFYALGGYSRARGTADLTNNGKVEAFWQSTIKTALLDVNVIDTFVSSNHRATGDAGGVYIGPADDEPQRNNPVLGRDIYWEAHVILLGEPNPELEIDADGTITKLTNIEFLGVNAGKTVGQQLVPYNGNYQVILDDIVYDEAGEANFFASAISGEEDGRIWGNRGLFESQRTWNSVKITNASQFDLVRRERGQYHCRRYQVRRRQRREQQPVVAPRRPG